VKVICIYYLKFVHRLLLLHVFYFLIIGIFIAFTETIIFIPKLDKYFPNFTLFITKHICESRIKMPAVNFCLKCYPLFLIENRSSKVLITWNYGPCNSFALFSLFALISSCSVIWFIEPANNETHKPSCKC